MRRRPLTITALALCLTAGATACSGVNPTVAVSGAPKAEPSASSIASVLAADEKGRFTTLLNCVELAGAAAAVTGTGPVTLFAPTNEAFSRAGVRCDKDSKLSGSDAENLLRTLAQHIVDEDVRFTEPNGFDPKKPPRGLVMVKSSQERVDSILLDADGTQLVVGADKSVKVAGTGSSAKIVDSDIQAPNGIIQVIDSVLKPPSKAKFAPTTEPPKPFE